MKKDKDTDINKTKRGEITKEILGKNFNGKSKNKLDENELKEFKDFLNIDKNIGKDFIIEVGDDNFNSILLVENKFKEENNFKFAKGLYHEDFGLVPLIILKAKKVASTNVGTYNYVQTQNSITRGQNSKKVKMAKDLLAHYDNMIKEIATYDVSRKSKENLKIYYIQLYLN